METTSFSTAARPLKLHQGRVDLGEVPKAVHGSCKTLPSSTN